MNQDIQKLNQLLIQENNVANNLLNLMLEEKNILEQNTPEKLTALSLLKADCLDQMENISLKRSRLLLALSSASTPLARMNEVIAQQSVQDRPLLFAAVEALDQALNQCNKQNAINGLVISMSQRNVQRNLNVIKGVDQDSMTYTQQGYTTSVGHSSTGLKV